MSPKPSQKKQPAQQTQQQKPAATGYSSYLPTFPRAAIGAIANEVAEVLMNRVPHMMMPTRGKKKLTKKAENALFFDTSAIIDGRIFSVIELGLFHDSFVVPEQILLELKHIADSQDAVKRERGRRGLEMLETLKKSKHNKVIILADEKQEKARKEDNKEVDEILISMAKENHGRILTCDYNLEKKANIQGVSAININALANTLKITAVPGESLHVQLLHQGKDPTQGVAYLDDGTMIVVEQASSDIGKTIDVVVARVIQTAAGRILFAKKI